MLSIITNLNRIERITKMENKVVDIDIDNVVLKTERLTLRPWKLSDLDDFFEYASVPGVGEMAGWPHHESKENSLEILNMFINERKTFAIELNGKVVGSLGIEVTNLEHFPELINLRVRELGYVLGKPYWGNGYIPEACNAVIDYLFNDVKLDAVSCCHFLSNSQSARVQEKLGFKHYRTFSFKCRNGEEKISEGGYILKEERNAK